MHSESQRSLELRRAAAGLTLALSGLCMALGFGSYFTARAAEKLQDTPSVQFGTPRAQHPDILPELIGFGAAEIAGGIVLIAATEQLVSGNED